MYSSLPLSFSDYTVFSNVFLFYYPYYIVFVDLNKSFFRRKKYCHKYLKINIKTTSTYIAKKLYLRPSFSKETGCSTNSVLQIITGLAHVPFEGVLIDAYKNIEEYTL